MLAETKIKIEIQASEAWNAFIVHDKERFFRQLPEWIEVGFSPYPGSVSSDYVSSISYEGCSYEMLKTLWDDPKRPMYNSYPTMRETNRVVWAVYNDCLERLNDKLWDLSNHMFRIGDSYGNPILRRSKFFQYWTQNSWGVFLEDTPDEEIVKTLNSHF